MTKIKKGDRVELRSNITSFMTLKLIGRVKRITPTNKCVVVDDSGKRIGKFKRSELEKRD